MSSRVLHPAASRDCQPHRPVRRYGEPGLDALRPGRLLVMLLVLLCFVRAVVIPPCDMHLSGPTAATQSGTDALTAAAHHHSSSTSATEHGDEHDGACTCVGDCHPASATPLVSQSPALVLAATVTVANAHLPAAPPNILPIAQEYVLPFGTAPPTHEV